MENEPSIWIPIVASMGMLVGVLICGYAIIALARLPESDQPADEKCPNCDDKS